MPEIAAVVGTKIRAVRRAKGMSLERLAELADLSLTYTGDIERGKKDPSLKTLLKLSRALGVRVSVFLASLEGAGQAVSKKELTDLLQPFLRDYYTQEEAAEILAFVQRPVADKSG